jgi:hypothetical protein
MYTARHFAKSAARHVGQDYPIVVEILRYLEVNPITAEEFCIRYPHYSAAVMEAVALAQKTAQILNEREQPT